MIVKNSSKYFEIQGQNVRHAENLEFYFIFVYKTSIKLNIIIGTIWNEIFEYLFSYKEMELNVKI